MWNFLVSGLSIGSTLVLYDGSPLRNPSLLWKLAEDLGITIFGTSAKYLDQLSVSHTSKYQQHPFFLILNERGFPILTTVAFLSFYRKYTTRRSTINSVDCAKSIPLALPWHHPSSTSFMNTSTQMYSWVPLRVSVSHPLGNSNLFLFYIRRNGHLLPLRRDECGAPCLSR